MDFFRIFSRSVRDWSEMPHDNICKIVKWIDPGLFCNAERCVFILISCDCSGTSDSERLLLPLCCL